MATPVPGAPLPLLAAQQRQWISHHEDPGNPQYNCGGYYRISGELREEALTAAVAAAYSETEALRVIFHEQDGKPWQTVVEADSVPLSSVELPGEAAAIDWMASALAVPFDLLGGEKVCSHTLVKTGEREWFFFFRYHHIALDAYGAHRYLLRVVQHYNALVTGEPAPPGGFAGLARLVAEEHAYGSSPRAQRDEAYWRRILSTPVSRSGFASRDTLAGPRPLRSVTPVSDKSRAAFLELSARTGVRWPVLVIAVTACRLSFLTGSRDVVIGLLAANRSTLAAVKTPANLANELPLRIDVRSESTFLDLLGQVGERLGEAITHQRVDLGRLPGSPTLRTFVNVIAFGEQHRFTDCASEFRVLATGPASNFRVNCYGDATGDLLLEYEANSNSYDEAQLARHQEGILSLLDELATMPDARLSDVFPAAV
ncbi:condensation domain-containing protein [Amycolatopsis pigmentata]|uniref:Condensation domain-containing protein n=1 Tax=Amycolatopsis pigmentata TaxID=450801 RepID=A0ABW5FZQ8_9PSEU